MSVGVVVGVTVGVSVGVDVGVVVGVSEGVEVTVVVGVSVDVGGMVVVFVGVCVGTGSREDAEFCGCGTLLSTKSFALLSVSSPLPLNSSIPPLPIVDDVEEEFA